INAHFKLYMKQSVLTQLYVKAMVFLAENKKVRLPVPLDDENHHRTFSHFKTKSKGLIATIQIAKQIAKTTNTIHIGGEIGTGKRLLAEMIHNHSPMSKEPFYVYNCLDKEPEMIEEELFGNKTRTERKEGIIDSITNGTLYIKHIDNLPYSLQGNLLE